MFCQFVYIISKIEIWLFLASPSTAPISTSLSTATCPTFALLIISSSDINGPFAAAMAIFSPATSPTFSITLKEGIILPKRGRYGTCITKIPNKSHLQPNVESAIFAKSQFTARYHYNHIQDSIKNLIIEKYTVNSKLPSIIEMAEIMDVSPNTIRKAYSNLSKEGYLTFTRGKYGGTFVKQIPQSIDNKPFEWVAVNPKYADFNEN